MKLSLDKLILLESLLLTAPLATPYIYNKWNHAKIDSISNKKELDLYKKITQIIKIMIPLEK